MRRHLITSALPYINGVKHLGNLIGSILPADVYARYLRQSGEDVLYICGTDEHGTPAELAAKAEGEDIKTYCQKMYATQKKIYEDFAIEFDYFGRSSAPENHATTQAIFKALDANGYIEERDIQQVYSNADARFLPDRYVVGTCPHCGYERARGDQCEACGRLLDTTDLINPRSAISDSSDLEIRTSKHLFLQLQTLAPKVKEWVDAHDNWPAVTKGTAKKWLDEGLQERCISRDLKWGVSIPKPGFEDKVFYVWFDAPIAYISITQQWANAKGDNNAWQQWWWETDADTHYYQFMAKDNLPFHTIFWPAIMLGTAEPWKLPDVIKGFNWLTYESGKFSTSQKRGIFTDTALELFPADYWRYYLLANAPESSDADFTFPHFANTINKDLADILGNFVSRVNALVKKHFDGNVPAYQALNSDDALFKNLQLHLTDIDSALSDMQFRKATTALRNLWAYGNEYITQEEPWRLIKTDKNQAGQVLANCLHLIYYYAIAAHAFIPHTAAKLFAFLGMDKQPGEIPLKTPVTFDVLASSNPITLAENLFQKIDETQVEALQAQFAGE